jgi:hypothetical protein
VSDEEVCEVRFDVWFVGVWAGFVFSSLFIFGGVSFARGDVILMYLGDFSSYYRLSLCLCIS